MPHDAKGREVKPGDVVMVPFVVKEVHLTEDFCNLNLETVATMPPHHRTHSAISVNARMVLRANSGDDLDFVVVHGLLGATEIK